MTESDLGLSLEVSEPLIRASACVHLGFWQSRQMPPFTGAVSVELLSSNGTFLLKVHPGLPAPGWKVQRISSGPLRPSTSVSALPRSCLWHHRQCHSAYQCRLSAACSAPTQICRDACPSPGSRRSFLPSKFCSHQVTTPALESPWGEQGLQRKPQQC